MLIGSCLLAAFVKSLLFVPPKTPFLLVAPSLASPYEAPLAPDAWIAEDADRFHRLDDAGTSSAGILIVHDASNDWHSVSQGLDGLRHQLRQIAADRDGSEAVILYVSMHGAVDDLGNPCLILPSSSGTSEIDASSWVPLSELFDAIKAAGFRQETLKLLVLDSSRFRINWGLGTIYNTFTDCLQNAVQAGDVPNLVVFNSVSAGEIAWTSTELRGSVFTHFLQRGLSGDADDRDAGGNEDRRVSLSELDRYVSQRVRNWVWHNRGENQHPLLFASRRLPGDTTVSWALRPAEREAAQRQVQEPPLVEAAADRERFWRRYVELNERGAATTDPLSWARLQQSLLRFEQCLAAGRAYASAARDARATVSGLLRQFDEFDSRTSDCLVGTRRHDLDVLQLFSAPSLPLTAALSAAPDGELRTVESALEGLATSADASLLSSTLHQLDSVPIARRMVEVNFLRLLQQYRIAERFPQPDVLPTAITGRRWAERAAAPCDERLLADARTTVDEVDASRRTLEDQLFAGLPFSGRDWESVRQRYQVQFDVANSAASDLHWRDQVLAELPWLGQWLTRLSLQTNAEETEQLDGQIADNLRTLIRAVCRTTADQFLQQTATPDLREDYRTLRSRVDDEYVRLLSLKQADGQAVRDALWLLDLPLLPHQISVGDVRSPVDARLALHTLVSQWSSQLAAGSGAATSEPPPDDTDAERGARFLARIESSWRYHPAIEMFADTEQAEGAAELSNVTMRLVARESKLRQTLATLSDQLKAIRDESLSVNDHAQSRRAWSEAERLSRALAALTAAPLEVDAPLELRRLDLKQLLMWQSQRALNDFYGSADSRQTPFFAQAARDCLAAARQLESKCTATRQHLAELENLLEQRRSLAAAGPSTKLLMSRVSDVVIIDEHIPASTTVSLVPADGATSVDLPPGLAALYVDAVPLEPGPLPTVSVPLDEPAQHAVPVLESLIQALPSDTAGAHAAILAFRGHQFSSPFEIAHLDGPISRYVPTGSESADILVIGPQQRPPDVLFVLDCSASMQQPLALEGGDVRRFDAAVLALRPMLEELAREGNIRIGVELYGHRARWDHEHVGDVLRQTGYGRPISPNQMPFDDVEVVLPIGRFDPTIAGQLFSTLKTVAPWGESPLYLALTEAIRQFPPSDKAQQSIILITDGLNSQFNAPREKRKYLPDVLQALGARRIPIHIIGFGINDNEAQEAQQAYQQLADSSQGSYAPVEEATELVEYVRGLITRETYTVQDGGRFLASTGVGSLQRVNEVSRRVQPMTVSAGNAAIDVMVEGGESLRLQLSADGAQLLVAPYLAGSPRFYPLTGNAGEQWMRPNLGIHQPLRRQNEVEFEFSIQDPAGRFVPRPRTVWIEATPVLADGTRSQSYTFYDRNFESDVGVPALRWRAAEWPSEAVRAEVQFFCRFDEIKPDLETPVILDQAGVSQTFTVPGPVSGSLTVEHLPGQNSEWRVVEQYDVSAPEFPLFRVELIAQSGPTEVVRQFDARHQVCLHQFRLAESSATPPVLRVTRRDRERVGAWQLAAPVQVDIAGAEGLIVLPNP